MPSVSSSTGTSLAGGVEITKAGELPSVATILLWGPPGAGKTTLACTAPGEKLIVNFDPNGPSSVAFRSDVSVLDYSAAPNGLTAEFKSSDPFGISKHIGPYGTIIVDSLSSVQELTTRQGVEFARGLKINSNIENPGLAAFQARNNLLLELVRNLLAVARRAEKHIIFIAHEGQKDKDKEGSVINIPIMLGGGLPTNIGVKLSEIWPMYELREGKFIAVRPARMREIAKTRMFQTTGVAEFKWKFNPDLPDEEQSGMTIAGWLDSWQQNGKRKIPLPR